MRLIFSPELVNGPFGDPGLLLDFKFERRALLLDLGDVTALPPKKLLRVSDVFVSHTHMDHFYGFDRLLRVCVGRETGVRLYGPPGFLEQVEHKLAAYTWNLVENYPVDFAIAVHEVAPDWSMRAARFGCHRRFRREPAAAPRLPPGVLLDDPAFSVRAEFLDHKTACLAFAVEEKMHVNVWKNRLAELGLPTGPWLKALKDAVFAGAPKARRSGHGGATATVRTSARSRSGSSRQRCSGSCPARRSPTSPTSSTTRRTRAASPRSPPTRTSSSSSRCS
ncbi:MAG: MBL fold metallo-hydrolase [Burkholderiales bacterium]|nr:MBL fold metallo-hydrolase [Burkholderiales bacterium]